MGRFTYLRWLVILLVSFCAAQEDNESQRRNVRAASPSTLLFHRRAARFITVSDDRRVAHRRNNYAFGETAALIDRPLDPDEVFEVLIESYENIENPKIGVTTISPSIMPYPKFMNQLRSGTWGWDVGPGQIYQDGAIILESYPSKRPEIRHGDTFGVSVTSEGILHFHHNGKDLGEATRGLNGGDYYAYIDLYWGGSNATIVNYADFLALSNKN